MCSIMIPSFRNVGSRGKTENGAREDIRGLLR